MAGGAVDTFIDRDVLCYGERDPNGTASGVALEIDPVGPWLVTIPIEHHQIHEGEAFSYWFNVSAATTASGATVAAGWTPAGGRGGGQGNEHQTVRLQQRRLSARYGCRTVGCRIGSCFHLGPFGFLPLLARHSRRVAGKVHPWGYLPEGVRNVVILGGHLCSNAVTVIFHRVPIPRGGRMCWK